MKTSNKILLAVAIIPVILIVGTIVSLRVAFERRTDTKTVTNPSEERIIREYQYSGFSKIMVSGVWDLKIFQGNEYFVEISAPEYAMDSISAREKNDQLILDYLPDYENSGLQNMPKAAVMVPSISTIYLMGTCRLDLREFNTDYLNVVGDGEVRMTVSNTAITNLDLVSQGVSEWDFSKASVVNARVRTDGTFSILLFMNGGRLSGALNGIGTLTYTGAADITDMKKKDPMSRIVYRKDL
jgi:hypothetical protein